MTPARLQAVVIGRASDWKALQGHTLPSCIIATSAEFLRGITQSVPMQAVWRNGAEIN
jgi:hypothetical protein